LGHRVLRRKEDCYAEKLQQRRQATALWSRCCRQVFWLTETVVWKSYCTWNRKYCMWNYCVYWTLVRIACLVPTLLLNTKPQRRSSSWSRRLVAPDSDAEQTFPRRRLLNSLHLHLPHRLGYCCHGPSPSRLRIRFLSSLSTAQQHFTSASLL